MRVAMDTCSLVQTRGGTTRHIEGLLPYLHGHVCDGGRVEIVPFRMREPVLHTWKGVNWVRDVRWYERTLPRRVRARSGQPFDLLHCPTYRAPRRPGIPMIVTVHDIAAKAMPDVNPGWAQSRTVETLPEILAAAAQVIAVSEFTKNELTKHYEIDEAKINVIRNAAGPEYVPDGPRAEGEYVLAVGAAHPRKNLENLKKATDKLGRELRIVSSETWNHKKIERLKGVSDLQLAELYRGALCLTYPSLYEGFGIPILEAMGCGTPVVTSRRGAMEEVAGHAAVLVDPDDIDSIAAGIEEAIDRKAELREAGLRRARDFSWEASAQATVDVYRNAVAA